jgi:hypothetical protein
LAHPSTAAKQRTSARTTAAQRGIFAALGLALSSRGRASLRACARTTAAQRSIFAALGSAFLSRGRVSHRASAWSTAAQRGMGAVWMLACLALPLRAAAYCRASDEVGKLGECIMDPDAPFLFWKRSCTSYQFNTQLFDQIERMKEPEIRASFQAAFDTWARVSCTGRAPFLVEQLPGTTESGSEYVRNAANEMVVLALDAKGWSALPDHSPRAIAMTLMWHSRTTGEILDTDIELNLGAGTFADCVAGSCNGSMVDLQNTITHEAGHVLGLGHSTDVDSTMAAQTVGAIDIQKRSLAPDDIAGYCALDLPEWRCTNASCSCEDTNAISQGPRTTRSCSAASTSTRSKPWWLATLLLPLWWRRRLARTRSRPAR